MGGIKGLRASVVLLLAIFVLSYMMMSVGPTRAGGLDLYPIEDQTVNETGELRVVLLGSYGSYSFLLSFISYSLIEGNGAFPSGADVRFVSAHHEDPPYKNFYWVPSEAQGPGVYDVGIVASDSTGLTDTEYFTITVREVNNAPRIILPPDINLPPPNWVNVDELAELSFIVQAVDPDIDPTSDPQKVTLECLACPSGSIFNPEAGRFSWAPTESQGGKIYSLEFKATDNGSPPLSSQASVKVEVKDIPPQLSLEISSTTSLIGFRVQISGTIIETDGTRPEGAKVDLVFSQGSGSVPIGTATTDQNGRFSVQWIPTLTGDYVIWAQTHCDSSYCSQGYASVALAVLPLETGQIFSVGTNSTVSGLAYNTEDNTLKFRLSGKSGEGARVDVSIAKSLLGDPNLLRVKANSTELPFEFVSVGDSWLVTFTVRFESTFVMTMEIRSGTASSGSLATFSNYWPYITVGVVLAVAGSYMFYRHSKARRATMMQVPTSPSSPNA